MSNFAELENINQHLITTLTENGFINPTEVQEKVIPIALDGADLLVNSQTGSGKTLAFCIPLLSKIISEKASSNKTSSGLILTPTREIAIQIHSVIRKLSNPKHRVYSALLIGGEPFGKQTYQIKNGVNIIIATPGRLLDHLNKSSVSLKNFNVLILDEFDRMLDMGFSDDIEEIMSSIKVQKQTLMFSATTNKIIEKNAIKYLSNPERIIIKNTEEGLKNTKQSFKYISSTEEKNNLLLDTLKTHTGSSVIFANTKNRVEILTKNLTTKGYDVNFIHGDLPQNKRKKRVKDFLNKKYNIIIATDVMARGVDIPHIKYVINYDAPKDVDDYIHRIGRTNRHSNKDGTSLCFVSKIDIDFMFNLSKIIKLEGINPDLFAKKHVVKRQNNKSYNKKYNNKKNRKYN